MLHHFESITWEALEVFVRILSIFKVTEKYFDYINETIQINQSYCLHGVEI